MQKTIGKTMLRLVTGDIADQDTDAVVTAAHWRLNKGVGTDGTIHSKGGPAIYEECRRIGGCPIGDAVITTGGNLKVRHVIHAVGPVWRGGDEDEPMLGTLLLCGCVATGPAVSKTDVGNLEINIKAP